MNPLLKLTMALHLIHACLSASCTFIDASDLQIKAINAARSRVLKEKPFLESYESHPDLFIKDSRITNICPKPLAGSSLTLNLPRKEEYLRGNTFSAVLSVEQDGEFKAVKVLSFAHFVKFKLEEELFDKNKKKIIEEIVKAVASMQILGASDKISSEKLEDYPIIPTELASLGSTAFANTIIKNLEKKVLSYLQIFREQIAREVNINEALQKLSAQLPNNVVRFQKCYFDAHLNAFIIADNAGPALSAVKQSCDGPLTGKGPLDIIARSRSLLFAVNQLHKLGFNFCSARPEHLAISADFDPRRVFLADFSEAVQERTCRANVSAFTPPEAFSKVYRTINFLSMTRPGITESGLFDAFNFGVLLASLELPSLTFETLSNTYENEMSKLKIAYEEGVISAKSNVVEKKTVGLLPTKKEADTTVYIASLKKIAHQFYLGIKIALEENVHEVHKTGKSQKGPKIEFSEEESQIDMQALDLATFAVQIYPRLVRQLINKIISGLLLEDFDRRLSIKEALYLFNLLSVLVKPEILASTDNKKVIPAVKVLQYAEVLFDEPDLLEMAVQGTLYKSEAFANLITNKIKDKEEQEKALTGNFEGAYFDKNQKKLIKAHALVKHVELPSFEKMKTELDKELLLKKERLLI